MKRILFILSLLALPVLGARGMDRMDALSQIESHNNDHAIGLQKEVSRYQILPVFWRQAKVVWRPTDPAVAEVVVNWIMSGRCHEFEARYHRAPDNFEYYILWHRPSCYIGRSVPRHLSSAETNRARRFANLCEASN